MGWTCHAQQSNEDLCSPAIPAPILSYGNGIMQDDVADGYCISQSHCIPEFKDPTPPKIMPTGYRELLKDDLNGNAALDTAGTAKEGVLPERLELPERDNGRMSWGPDFKTIRGTRLQDSLLQPDQQLHRVGTLQIAIPGEDGPHGGASLAEAGLPSGTACLTFPSSRNSMPR